MTEKVNGLPVAGYQAQTELAIELVNMNKQMEELVLQLLDTHAERGEADPHWLAIGRSHIEQGFMAVNRAIFKPGRVTLPEDVEG